MYTCLVIFFNPDANKQAEEVIFSRKLKTFCHPSLRFNNNNVSQTSSQKHLGLTLDNRLTFDEHLTNVSIKISKTIGLLRNLQNILPRSELLTIYKCYKTSSRLWWYYLWPGLQLIFPPKIRIDSVQCCFRLNRGN